MRRSACTLLLLVSVLSCAAQLSGKERKLVQVIDNHTLESEALLKQVVNINSGTMNFNGVKEVGAVFIEKFKALGFETRWESGEAFDRAGHLIAEHTGDPSSPKILLIGHLDTVFEPDHPLQEYKQEGDLLYGPGVVDMKGGDVIVFAALQALNETGELGKMNIRVVFTGDEEKSGKPLSASKQALTDAAEWADIAIGFENGDSNFGTAVISRRGSIDWELRVTGTPAHSSQIFSEKVGDGAVFEAARILDAFRTSLAEEEYLTFNPGLILGGTTIDFASGSDDGGAGGKKNVVAQTVIVTGDLRAVSIEQLTRVKDKMTEIVSRSLAGTTAEIIFNDGYPPLGLSEGNRQLLEMYSKVSEDLGLGNVTAVDPIRAGAADISFTSGYVDMAMDGIGLSGGDDHTEKEFGELRRLPDLTKRAALLLLRLSEN